MKLNNWVCSTKIGSGACADVYEIDDEFVIKVAAIPKNSKTKKGKEQMRLANSLYAEYMIYQKLYRVKGIPTIPARAYGEANGLRYLVIQRLDRTLADMVKEQKRLSQKIVASYGISLIDTLKTLHAKNIIYVDIKPDNFMLDKRGDIYCVDFGICDSYIQAMNKKHKPQVFGSIVGTPTFLSGDCHLGSNCARRDDLEALCYVLLFAMKGSLPWEGAKSDIEGANIKKKTTAQELCIGLHPNWALILSTIRNYAFEQMPDYEWIKEQLEIIHEESR